MPINAFNYDHEDVEQALVSKHAVFAAKSKRNHKRLQTT